MKLIDYCINITDGTHNTVIDTPNTNFYLLSCKNVKDGKIEITDQDRTISESTLLSLRKRTNLEINDVVITSVGTIGEVATIKCHPYFEFQRSVALIKPNSNKIMSKYLEYYLISGKGQREIKSRIKGVAQPCLFLNDIKNIEISVHKYNDQRHIVNTIGTVDDLIENYQKQVEKIIKFGDDKLRFVSKKKQILDYAFVSLGGTPSKKHPEYWNGNFKWINSGAITGTPAILYESETITELGIKHSAKKPAQKGDTVLSIIEPSKNKVAIIMDNNVYFNQSIICISPKDKNNGGFLFFAARFLVDEIKGYATGSAQQSLNKNIVEKSCILSPNPSIINQLKILQLNIIELENKIRNLNKIKQKLLEKYF
ncbi:type I restriction enzyme S subunit [Metamycoplasma subdolum]|uniref:Type I restriction enzyme S subunit n=1 Tax=Metamycoplasma subdolum TaxID=92407 RepID=A0A3M0A1T7_9BACT|nr:restriction endonuclease subunit S [Metamycoplasma subdolum]RMA78617.1 type I restriction enzyme S subunit [Metamycoplasma subdolum]WPB50781.1 restriction endonuclease subunit S [Metamycoplasma subdolum]